MPHTPATHATPANDNRPREQLEPCEQLEQLFDSVEFDQDAQEALARVFWNSDLAADLFGGAAAPGGVA